MSGSPFKFLDAYEKEDKDRFFGRERETAQLFNAVHQSNLVVLYGGSGTGKTSLINCGLGNQFLDSDWLPLFVRRGANLNRALDRAIAGAMKGDSAGPGPSIAARVRALYLDHYRPVYLIFDQFEELFILGTSEEQAKFYQTVREVLDARQACKVLLVLREEYIAYLSDFEKVVPSLLDNRLRVEQMNDGALGDVILGTAQDGDVEVVDPDQTVSSVLANVRDLRTGVDLANLQVYLDRLWSTYREEHPDADVVFDPALVEQVGELPDVLSKFLDEEMKTIEGALEKKGLEKPAGVPLEILWAMVTEDGTKRPTDGKSILEELPPNRGISESHVQFCMDEFARIRLVRQLAAD